MATEIERKWLVPLPAPAEVLAVEPELIEQGYLVIGADGSEVRLRRKSGRPVLTVKSSGTLSRSETEIDVTEEQYVALWPATTGRRVTKHRRRLPGGVDVDIYTGDLDGLAVAEVEFDSELEAAAFEPPAWFGADVTEDRAYKNQQLALGGGRRVLDFANEPVLELRRSGERDRCLDALAELEPRLPLAVPVIVGGERRSGSDLASVDPSVPERIVALACGASAGDVDSAVSVAARAGRAWGARSATDRAAVLIGAAAQLRARRYELAALEVLECAKPWAEADADVAEAIDFCEYYARRAVVMAAGPELLSPPGERNWMLHRPRGVAAVIAPWNFPIAIATGMTAAALVTGNGVCLKPAEQSPGCATAIVEAFAAAGLPAGVLNLLPGLGEVGAALVRHPDVATIAFTGSAAVGIEIMAAAARPVAGQLGLKRVVAELGGKNCLLVDADADLDDVVGAALYSAFGFAGQKCSATSRLLVHQRVAQTLVQRLRGALETFAVGPARDFAVDVPAVIESEAQARIESMLSGAGDMARVAAVPGDGGYYVAPALVFEPAADSELVTEEIFGPVLSIEAVPDMAAAMDRVESQRQALTGGLFSRNPETVAMVAARTPVGNLYVNRGTTGAMVGRQPFGGNRTSGTGSKAGGPSYLEHFCDPVAICEDTTRHGIPT